jgi:hypothetical protein
LPTKSTELLKELKRIAHQNKGTMLQFWAKQATVLPTKTVDSTLPIQFLANSSQFDEINSDCVAVLNDESENSKETAKAGVSKTKAQDEIKAQIHAINGDLTWLYNRKSIGILTKKSRNRVEREKKMIWNLI